MDSNFDNQEQNQNWQEADRSRSEQGWQDPNQGWQNPNWQNQGANPYYGEYNGGYGNNGYNNNNGQPNGGYPNGNVYPNGGYPNPNMPNQGYAPNGGYNSYTPNSYTPNGYSGPIVVSNAVPAKTGGPAVGSLVCGIISIICFWSIVTIIAAVVGLVLGIVNIAQDQPNKGLAVAGIVTNCLAILLTIAFIFFLAAL